jgi:hypothetical protein
MSWRQISPQQLLAKKNSSPEMIEAQRDALIESLNDFHIRELLELEQKLDKSLPLLLHEAIADLIDKYKHIK